MKPRQIKPILYDGLYPLMIQSAGILSSISGLGQGVEQSRFTHVGHVHNATFHTHPCWLGQHWFAVRNCGLSRKPLKSNL